MRPYSADGNEVDAGSAPCDGEAAAASSKSSMEDLDDVYTYQLIGIVIHSGNSATAGHYYSFLKDRRYRKYVDAFMQ